MTKLPWDRDQTGSTWPKPPDGVRASSPLHYALRYIKELDWSVFPVHWIEDGRCSCGKDHCHSPGKHPVARHGFRDASRDEAKIRAWLSRYPKANIGVPTGRANGFFVLDLDKKPGVDGADSLHEHVSRHGPLPDRAVESLTGSGGRHVLFKYPNGVPGIRSGTNVFGPCADVRGDGGYIVVEPSIHVSGRGYAWDASGEPWDTPLPNAPDWVIERASSKVPSHDGGSYDGCGTGYLSPDEINDLRSALSALPSDDRELWVRVGTALKATDCGETAYCLWEEWSRKSIKYDPSDMVDRWRGFKPKKQVNKETIFYLAQEAGWPNPLATRNLSLEQPKTEPVEVHRPPTEHDYPNFLLTPPGILRDLLEWSIDTAHKPLPHLLLQSSLACVSAIAGRRYRTRRHNWPSLYFLNIARTGSGKEHCKTVVEQVLEATGNAYRMGGSGYTSASGVFSALMEKPAHITLIDEMGRFLESSQNNGNHHRVEAITQLIEVFGRCHGVLRPLSYSTLSANSSRSGNAHDRRILQPALSILGLTTPSTFYDSISFANVKDGFLGRFIVCESPIKRMPGTYPDPRSVPDSVVDWGMEVSRAGAGNLAGMVETPDVEPGAVELDIAPDADRLFRALEKDIISDMNALDEEGLDVLLGRTVEKSIRLSILCALAESANARTIESRHAEYAIEYVRWHDMNLIRSVRCHVSDSPFGRMRNLCLEAIRRAGERGLTVRDMNRTSRAFMSLKPREQNEVLESLKHAGEIQLREIANLSGRGHKRHAWVAIQGAEE